MNERIKAFVFGFPLYIIILIGEWYEASCSFTELPFSWSGLTYEYWGAWLTLVTTQEKWSEYGEQKHTMRKAQKARKSTLKFLREHNVPSNVCDEIKRLSDRLTGSTFWFMPDLDYTDGYPCILKDANNFPPHQCGYGFDYENEEWLFFSFHEDGSQYILLPSQAPVQAVYDSSGTYTSKPVSLEERNAIIESFLNSNNSGWTL